MIEVNNNKIPSNLTKVKQEVRINVCYSSDKNYAKYLSVSMTSILSNKNKEDKIYFYILDGGLTDNDKNKILSLKNISDFEIDFIKVDNNKFLNCPLENSSHLSKAAYYRLIIADLLSSVDKVIYLDCDVEIKTSLADLFNCNLNDKCCAAARDIADQKHCLRLNLNTYYNTGVLLLNLNKLREINFSDNIFDWINLNIDKIVLHDQDIINLYFKNSIINLDKKWNIQACLNNDEYSSDVKNAYIIHYVSRDKGDFIYKNIKNALKTGYKKELLKLFVRRILKFIAQWLFRIRNKNKCEKEITILGIKFFIKHSKK